MGVGQYAMMNSVTASPLSTGSCISTVTTSGRCCRQSSMAVLPSPASPTTCICGSAESTSTRRLRTVSESSTTNTRILHMDSPHQLLDRLQEMALVEFALYDVGPGAGFLAAAPVFRRRQGGDHDGRDIPQNRVRARPGNKLKTIDARHLDIHQEQAIPSILRHF